MSKTAKCELCNRDIDITDQRFCDSDEMPIVLSAQLDNDTEEEALELVQKLNEISVLDYADDNGDLHMYHYDHHSVSHKDYDDKDAEKHHLATGFWSFQ